MTDAQKRHSPTVGTWPTARVIHFRHTVWSFSPLCHTIIVTNKQARDHLAISTSTFIQWNLFLHYSQSHWPIKLILTCVHLITNKNDWFSKTSHFSVSSTIASFPTTNQRWPYSLTDDTFIYCTHWSSNPRPHIPGTRQSRKHYIHKRLMGYRQTPDHTGTRTSDLTCQGENPVAEVGNHACQRMFHSTEDSTPPATVKKRLGIWT